MNKSKYVKLQLFVSIIAGWYCGFQFAVEHGLYNLYKDLKEALYRFNKSIAFGIRF